MENKYISLKDMLVRYEKEPETTYLWNGVKDKSFGLIYGPSKSGKTIFCENLAMHLASGKTDYFGYPLDGTPKKVLFIGLEEFWRNRVERNKKQFESFSVAEQQLIGNNYKYQEIDFNRLIINETHFSELDELIKTSDAQIVFIDSITRMNSGKLEESHNAEKIMQRLRSLCYDNQITLFCIHHTPKMQDTPITMDKIKGSSAFAQEADFAIGVSCTSNKVRYMKNVFFRYAPDDDDVVKEFIIEPSCMLTPTGDATEEELLRKTDRRTSTNIDAMASMINGNANTTLSTAECVEYFISELGIKERQIKYNLTELVKEGKIQNPSWGVYASIDYQTNNEDGHGV